MWDLDIRIRECLMNRIPYSDSLIDMQVMNTTKRLTIRPVYSFIGIVFALGVGKGATVEKERVFFFPFVVAGHIRHLACSETFI